MDRPYGALAVLLRRITTALLCVSFTRCMLSSPQRRYVALDNKHSIVPVPQILMKSDEVCLPVVCPQPTLSAARFDLHCDKG